MVCASVRPDNGLHVFVVIPALNEEEAIGTVIRDIPKWMVKRIIVVDNGSDDKTAEIAGDHGAFVIREPRRGYGWACLAGIEHVLVMVNDMDECNMENVVIVFLDGDRSDHPREMKGLLDPIAKNSADLVIGSRILGEGGYDAMGNHAYFANRLFGLILSRVLRDRITDLGPFRAIRLGSLLPLEMHEKTYGWTMEMIVKAELTGVRVREVPVSYRDRLGTSKISGNPLTSIKAFLLILHTLAKYLVITNF